MVNTYKYLNTVIQGKIIKLTSSANCFDFVLHEKVRIIAKHRHNERYYIVKDIPYKKGQYGYVDKECLQFDLIDKILKQL